MRTSITELRTWHVRCECGWTEGFDAPGLAERANQAHLEQHRTQAGIGRTLAGKVFDIDAPYVKGFGYIDNAAKAAIEAGYAYFTWNGNVLTSIDADWQRPVCRVEDVPGITGSKVT